MHKTTGTKLKSGSSETIGHAKHLQQLTVTNKGQVHSKKHNAMQNKNHVNINTQ